MNPSNDVDQAAAPAEAIRLQRHGDIAVITPSQDLEKVPEDRREKVVQMILVPLQRDPPLGVVFDLSQVGYVGSIFLSFLLRCHKRAKENGSEVVLAGAHPRARELLHLTALDTLWPLYTTLAEALAAFTRGRGPASC